MKLLKLLAFVCLSLLAFPAVSDPLDLGSREYLLPQEAAAIKQNVIFLDVRTEREWRAGHIKGAVHIPFDEVPERIAAEIPDRSIPLVVYCASGGRALHALKALKDLGYTAVPVVKGGYRQMVVSGMERECTTC